MSVTPPFLPFSPDNNISSNDAPTKPTHLKIHKPVLKIMGLGGGGTNAINRMIETGLSGVEFIAANTDRQALESSLAPVKIQLGPNSTRGLGSGGIPASGRRAAEESWRQIGAALQGADMVFLTAGMGGGTGTGAIPVTAKIARSMIGAVTIAIVTTPFSFEAGRRTQNAAEGLARLQPNTDTLITIPNDRLLYIAQKNLPLDLAFRMADDVLRQSIQGITELITSPGFINVDFANVRHLMKLGGGALMSMGQGEGNDKALKAVKNALNHPLLESTSLDNAAGILVNFTCGDDLTLFEIDSALSYLQHQAGDQAEVVMGVVNDERMSDRVNVTLVVTGLGAHSIEEAIPGFRINNTNPVVHSDNEPATSVSQTGNANHYSPRPSASTNIEMNQSSIPVGSQNLDIPAFLRRAR